MAGLLYLPNQSWTVATKGDINAGAAATGSAADRQITVAGDGQRLRMTYGRDRLGADLVNVVTAGHYVYAVCVWGLGPIDAVEWITMGDRPITNYVVDHYLGLPGEGVHAGLKAAFALNGIDYNDAPPGVAYSVISGTVGQDDFDPLSIAAIIRGRQVYDPRTGITAWSDNPALCLANFIVSPDGMGRAVDWPGVIAAANACDEIVGGVKRRRIGLTLDEPLPCETWVETLRTYAGCFVVRRESGWRLVPDRPAASVASFDHAAGQVLAMGPLRKRRRADAPTVMTVRWTDASALPWRDCSETVYLPGVQAGTVPRRLSEIALPGIQSASQARREAIERINKLSLSDLSFTVDVFDEAGTIEEGDIVTVTYAPRGLSAKLMRVSAPPDNTSAGRYTLSLAEYDPASYSDFVVTEPTTPDTSLPSPSAPLPVVGLTLEEEVFQQQDGTSSSRIRASWLPPGYPWVSGFRIDVRVGGAVVQVGSVGRSALSWPSWTVQELVPHQVDVFTRSSIGAESIAASAVIVPKGKQLPPGNVASLSGYEVGGEVRLRWTAAVDIDIWRYEIRWGVPGVSWGAATLLDRVDALSLVSKDTPAGTWDYLVCALDSVGNYSPSPARKTVTVTLDAASILVDRHDFSAPVFSGMQEYSLWPGDPYRRWISEDNIPMADKFVGALADYPDPMGAYSASANSWQTEAHDFGILLAGNWAGELSVTALAGTVDQYLDLSPDGSTWSSHAGLTAKTGGRFSRLRVDVSGAALVLLPIAQLRIDAIPRQEEGIATSSSSGPCTVTLAGVYALSKGLPQITVGGTGFATATVDNIITGNPTSFDVYVYDDAANLISRDFGYVWKGI